jgi:chromosome segregation ATPase
MAKGVLHFKDKNGEWKPIYLKDIRNRLRKDKNLADLTDKTAARENLELTGDVGDHHHDSRYFPLFESAVGHADAIDERLQKIINDLAQNLNNVQIQCNSNTDRITDLEDRMVKAENRITKLESQLSALTTKFNNLFDSEGFLTYPNGNKLRVVKK